MKKTFYIPILASIFLLTGNATYGQFFKKLKNKVENKIEKEADDLLNGKESGDVAKNETSGRAGSIDVYDFVPGANVIFIDSIQFDRIGKMPKYWKSGGTGSVVEFPGVEGNWLNLTAFTTYKLDTLFAMPENFTIEFDVLTRSNELEDLNTLSFGFSSDNSISGYENNVNAKTEIQYHNQKILNISDDTDLYNSYDFDLQNYGNAIMHVAIQVNGEHMKVYLDKSKVLDSKMFDAGRKKYFFINPSTRLDNNAEIAISNFEVAI